MLKNHFLMSGAPPQPDYMISYTAEYKVPFIGGDLTKNLTMWETGDESESLATFNVVSDNFSDGYGAWGIKTSDSASFYGLIKDENGLDYSMDSGNFHTITGLVFPDYDYDGNYITSIGGPLLGGGEGNSLTDVTLPYYLRYLGDSTFKGSTLLQTITIPEYVESLGNYAFQNCTSLTSITIPKSVQNIGEYAFQNCTSLTSITIPEYITTSIGKNAFQNCTSLTEFWCNARSLPTLNGLDIFGNYTDIPNLTIYVPALGMYLNHDDWKLYTNILALNPKTIGFKSNTVISLPSNTWTEFGSYEMALYAPYGHYTFEHTVTNVPKCGFENRRDLIEVYLPNTVTSIGDYAFLYCSYLESVIIPDSVTSVGNSIFALCNSISSLIYNKHLFIRMPKSYSGAYVIPEGIKQIVGGAFADCPRLTSITIPNSVTSIGYSASSGCSGLTSMVVESGNTVYDSRENCNAVIETATNTLISGCPNTIIPNSVTSIRRGAFSSLTSLTSITYNGTLSEWDAITKESNWCYNTPISVVHCTDGDVTL